MMDGAGEEALSLLIEKLHKEGLVMTRRFWDVGMWVRIDTSARYAPSSMLRA